MVQPVTCPRMTHPHASHLAPAATTRLPSPPLCSDDPPALNTLCSNNHLENLKILCANCHAIKTAEERRANVVQKCKDCGIILSQQGGWSRCWKCWNKMSDANKDRSLQWGPRKRAIAENRKLWPSDEELIQEIQTTSWKLTASRIHCGVVTLRNHLEDRGFDVSSIAARDKRPLRKIDVKDIVTAINSTSYREAAKKFGVDRESLKTKLRENGIDPATVFSKNWTVGKARKEVVKPV